MAIKSKKDIRNNSSNIVKSEIKNSDVKKEKQSRSFSQKILILVIFSILSSSILIGAIGIYNMSSLSYTVLRKSLTEKLYSDFKIINLYIRDFYGTLTYEDDKIVDQDGNSLENRYEVVDKIFAELGNNATIFIREDDEFRRISTDLRLKDGTRAINTNLEKETQAYKSIIEGNSYIGEIYVLNKPYLALYEPLKDGSGFVFGIIFTGIPFEHLNNIISKYFFLTLIIFCGLFLLITSINLFISNQIIGKTVKPILSLKKKLEDVTKGDLTMKFLVMSNDEVGQLTKSISAMVDTLKNLNQKIYVAVIILTKNLRSLYKSSNAVKDSANTQAVTVEETQKNFESMNKMVETISNESAKANKYTDQALKKANSGMESMQNLEIEMSKIESSSQEITNIIEMINEIAEQTNLLSLNASIESARAGEAGRGFNIVAGEIRKLAEKSTIAANRIHELITNNNKIIQEGVKYSKNTTNILREISVSNELITGLVKTITDEVQKVKFSSQESLEAIGHISNIAQANLKESESVSKTMNDFVKQTLELQKFVGQFDVRSESIKENQKHIEEILKSKLIETGKILQEYGANFLPTGNIVDIGDHKVQELQIGSTIVTKNFDIVDNISKRTNASVTIFQVTDDKLVRVATTVRNFDNTRAVGTVITSESQVYKTIMERKDYFGRAFVVNKWYVSVYKPILDETGYIFGVIYLGIPEEMEVNEQDAGSISSMEEDEEIPREEIFKHDF